MESRFNFSSVFHRSAGGALRHPPLRSVFTVLICFIFIFNLCSPVPVSASSAIPFSPTIPFIPYSNNVLQDQWNRITQDQKKAVEFLWGISLDNYAGYGGYNYSAPFSSVSSFVNTAIRAGSKLVDTYFDLRYQAQEFARDTFGSMLTGFVSYAEQYVSDFDTWFSDTVYSGGAGRSFSIEVPDGIYQDLIDLVGSERLYNWQFSTSVWSNDFSWVTSSLGSYQNQYNTIVDGFTEPIVRANRSFSSYEMYNIALSNPGQLDLFVNTSNSTVYFVDENGLSASSNNEIFNRRSSTILWWPSRNTLYRDTAKITYGSFGFNPNNYSSLVDVVKAALNSSMLSTIVFYSSSGYLSCYCDPLPIVRTVYYGTSWADRRELVPVDDLSFDETYKGVVIDIPSVNTAIKVSEYIEEILDGETDTRQLVDQTVVDMDTSLPLTDSLLKAITVNVSMPTTGITVNSDMFSGGIGYIRYLWQQTQPLVLFVRDLITCFTFDGTGLAWIFFGTVMVGLIGGAICKFLL